MLVRDWNWLVPLGQNVATGNCREVLVLKPFLSLLNSCLVAWKSFETELCSRRVVSHWILIIVTKTVCQGVKSLRYCGLQREPRIKALTSLIVSIKTFSSLREFFLVSVEHVLEDAFEGRGVRFQPFSTILQGTNLGRIKTFVSTAGALVVITV